MTLENVPSYDRNKTSQLGEQAVVIGASFAGLCTARVLADYFERIVVLERDELPDAAEPRRGVPQGQHAHGLLTTGGKILDDILPGYGEEIVANGGVENDLGSDWITYLVYGYVAETPTSMPIYCASRPLFELVLRRRVNDLDSVELRFPHHYLDYVLDDDGHSIAGVTVRNADGEEEMLAAELVVDATGRTSRTSTWLRANDFQAPPKDEVHVDLAYSTGFIHRPPGDDTAIRVGPHEKAREAFVLPTENDRWIVTLIGRDGDHPPADPDELVSFADSLAAPDVHQLLENHEWVSEEIAHYPFPSNRRYRYEELDQFPNGLLVVGDSITSYNPTYGQGMSVAALEALVLHHTIGEAGLDDLGPRFFERATPVIDAAWFYAVTLDHVFPGTSGPIPPGTGTFQEYMISFLRTAHTDGNAAEALLRVTELEEPPSSLLDPSVVSRVFDVSDVGEGRSEAPAWAPSAISEVGTVLEDRLTEPAEITSWPGFASSSNTEVAGDGG